MYKYDIEKLRQLAYNKGNKVGRTLYDDFEDFIQDCHIFILKNPPKVELKELTYLINVVNYTISRVARDANREKRKALKVELMETFEDGNECNVISYNVDYDRQGKIEEIKHIMSKYKNKKDISESDMAILRSLYE